MADLNTKATVDLVINGAQAGKVLKQAEERAEALRKKIDLLAKSGKVDSKAFKAAQKELRETESLIRNMTVQTQRTEQVMKNLNKASLKDLQRTLSTLQAQMKNIERGTAAWDRQAAAIQRVKEQIRQANAALNQQPSLWSKIKNSLGGANGILMSIVAGLTGFIAAGKKAVKMFAEMEEKLADTMKFTGMTREGVEKLNDAFKAMDTRTSREQLNSLAAEAGRLGKTTQADVVGYVKAADIINVALSDLGEGATQSIAKLSNIFKIEDKYGTYDSMVKIGSVVNVLSQNCTASEHYLVEFANRLAGVGNQAGISLQNIIGMGAVLDANAQKVEASSTAIGQVLTRMYRDPSKYAKVAGMDVEKFANLLKKDANEAFLQFLETLSKAGKLDVLSPMFKDMGENGARVITALSTMAQHIDEVRWQQKNANAAFNEGTSVLHEFEIFNNTAQASLDKAKKRAAELAISLGEKLYPVMRHVYSSSALFLRVLNAMVDFFIEYKRELLLLGIAIASYTVVAKGTLVVSKAWNAVCTAGGGIMRAYRIVVLSVELAYAKLTGQTTKAAAATKMLNAATSVSPWGIIISLVVAVAGAIYSFYQRTKQAKEEAERKRKELQEWKRSLTDLDKASADYSAKELTRLKALYKDATNAALATDKRRVAAEKLQSLYPDIFRNMSTENIMLGKAKKQYDNLTSSIIKAGRARAAAAKIEENESVLLELESQKEEYEELKKKGEHYRNRKKKELSAASADMQNASDDYRIAGTYKDEREAKKRMNEAAKRVETLSKSVRNTTALLERNQTRLDDVNEKIEAVQLNNEKLAKKFDITSKQLAKSGGLSPDDLKDDEEDSSDGYTPVASAEDKKRTREEAAAARRAAAKGKKEFKDELNSAKGDWEAGEALNLAEYSQGLKRWSEFLAEKHRLQIKFYDDQMEVFRKRNLEEDEDYQELLKKKEQANADWLKRQAALEVKNAQFEQGAAETQAQMDYHTPGNEIYNNERALQQRLFDLKILYLTRMQAAYEEGSQEWQDYEEKITTEEETERLRIQKEFSESFRKWSKTYAMQSDAEKSAYELKILDELYKQGLIKEKEYQEARRKIQQEAGGDDSDMSSISGKTAADIDKVLAEYLVKIKGLFKNGVISEDELESLTKKAKKKAFSEKLDIPKGQSEYVDMLLNVVKTFNEFSADDTPEQKFAKIGAAAQASFAVINAGLEAYMQYASAANQAELAAAEKKYDRLAAMSEGNAYKAKQAETKKEKEIAKLKAEQQKKQFAIQVLQAVATTAMNAIAAYGAGLQVGGPAGLVLAPIAAALAVAAGAVQIASIKKQKEAAESTGYMKGGFTPSGAKDKEVGVVHAGEWVAPQELVNNPKTRPMIDYLEQARRSNRIGSIRAADVSRTITAPMVAAHGAQQSADAPQITVNSPAPDLSGVESTLGRLNERLSQPIVAHVSIKGEHGIEEKWKEYERLKKNKNR